MRADHTLETYSRAMDQQSRSRKQDPSFYFSTVPAGIVLEKMMRNRRNAPVDPQLYDRFITSQRRYRGQTNDRQFSSAALRLVHPTQPDGSAALELLRSWVDTEESSPLAMAMLQPQEQNAAYVTFWFLVRTAQVLNRSGRVADALSVSDFGRERFPHWFSGSWRKGFGLPKLARAAKEEAGFSSLDGARHHLPVKRSLTTTREHADWLGDRLG